jgi:RNA polymerase sigma-70 factor, ECF subfamily
MSTFDRAETAKITSEAEVDWASAYQELLPKVYHYFCLRTGNPAEAEDLTAATFERAWRDRERYRKDLGAFAGWLFGIARHVAITHYRKTLRDTPVETPGTDLTGRPTEETAMDQEKLARLASILRTLPAREQEIFSLKYGAQFTNRSIAKTMRITETNVGTILNRIVGRLRKQLEEEDE